MSQIKILEALLTIFKLKLYFGINMHNILKQLRFNLSYYCMRFSLIFVKRTIPEWQQCYYNYIECKQLIYICKKGYAIKCNIEDYGQ